MPLPRLANHTYIYICKYPLITLTCESHMLLGHLATTAIFSQDALKSIQSPPRIHRCHNITTVSPGQGIFLLKKDIMSPDILELSYDREMWYR